MTHSTGGPKVIGINFECPNCRYVLFVSNDRMNTPKIVCPFCQTRHR